MYPDVALACAYGTAGECKFSLSNPLLNAPADKLGELKMASCISRASLLTKTNDSLLFVSLHPLCVLPALHYYLLYQIYTHLGGS